MDWFWVFQQPKGQKRRGKGGEDNENQNNKKRKPPKPKPEPVEPPEQHHILDPVAEDFLKFLRLKDLKSARLVCRKWRNLSNKDFHDKSVTKIHNQMGDKTTDKVLEQRICSNYHVKNLEFLQFRPSHFLGEIFQLRGDRLNELTIHIHLFHFFLPVLRCCYECMPNLSKLKFDNTSHPKHCTLVWPIRGRLPGRKIPKTGMKTMNLKSFTFRPFGEYFYIKPTPAWEEWDREEFMNYLKACPQLVELNLQIEPFSVFENFMEGLLELKRDGVPVISSLTSFGVVINDEYTRDYNWDAKARLLNLLFIASPLQHLRFHLNNSVEFWPQLFENLPTTLRSLNIYQGYSYTYSHEKLILADLFKLTKNPLTNLSSLQLKLNDSSLILEAESPLKDSVRNSLEFVRNFYCGDKVVLSQVAALFPGLTSLNAKLSSRKEFMELISLFGKLEELEIKCYYSFSELDVLGNGAEGNPNDNGGKEVIDLEDWKSFNGLRGLKELRQFRVSSSLKPLCDSCVFEGFLSMPNLQKLELLSSLSSDKEKIFSDKASEALRENNLIPRIIGNRYGSFSRMEDNFM